MSAPLVIAHRHKPTYRVVQRGWANPMDASYSQRKPDNRWNTPAFPALYCCCSQPVARVVAQEVLQLSGVVIEDLLPDARPALVEISWTGKVVDVVSNQGVVAAGFPAEYPVGTRKEDTRRAAARWHRAGREGVVCRSASLSRQGFSQWEPPHQPWGEVAIFVQNAARRPQLLRTREDREWFD